MWVSKCSPFSPPGHLHFLAVRFIQAERGHTGRHPPDPGQPPLCRGEGGLTEGVGLAFGMSSAAPPVHQLKPWAGPWDHPVGEHVASMIPRPPGLVVQYWP